TDSLNIAKLRSKLGAFAYSGTLPSAKDGFTILENELVYIKVANKGGYVSEVTLKQFDRLRKGSGQLVKLVADNNAHFGIKLKTKDNRVLDTKELYFEPALSKVGEDQVLTMRLKAADNQYLEYRYVLKPQEYMVDFDVRSQGLNNVLDVSVPPTLEWDMKTYRNEK